MSSGAWWTWIFFAWRQGLFAFVEIVALLALVVATTRAFARIRPIAAALYVPDLVWVGYGTALTFAVWQRSPQALG